MQASSPAPVLVLVLFALFSKILASPTQRRQTTSVNEYYLQTSVINGTNDHGTDKQGLCVSGFHTGAGTSDVALLSDLSECSKGFLSNGSYQQFDYNSSIAWYLDLGYEPYAGWAPVGINAAETPTPGFTINGTQLLGASDLGFAGWLACGWWHGVPQLFYLIAGYEVYQVIPPSCSTVELQVVPI